MFCCLDEPQVKKQSKTNKATQIYKQRQAYEKPRWFETLRFNWTIFTSLLQVESSIIRKSPYEVFDLLVVISPTCLFTSSQASSTSDSIVNREQTANLRM